MATTKFTIQQIERFNDRITNCMDDPNCRPIFAVYLKILKKPMALNALKLWEVANSSNTWNDDTMLELIEDIDDFNENPLLSIAEYQHKIDYTKGECCRILGKLLPPFIAYLKTHHKVVPC